MTTLLIRSEQSGGVQYGPFYRADNQPICGQFPRRGKGAGDKQYAWWQSWKVTPATPCQWLKFAARR